MNSTPNAENYNPDEDYLRELIAQSGRSISECARLCGISKSNFKQLIDSRHSSKAPYSVQFCLEVLSQNPCKTSLQEA